MSNAKIERRQKFLANCTQETKSIHQPILDLYAVDGALNPSGLGEAAMFSGAWGAGQSSIGFETLSSYHKADEVGLSPYNGAAEYGVVRSAPAAAVAKKISTLHGGAGAIVCASGLAAITITLEAFAPRFIAVPETVYYPFLRYVDWVNKKSREPVIMLFHYSGRASAGDIETLLQKAKSDGTPIDMIYLEAPGSGTFEIPDISGIASLARQHGIRSVMDNTWASHVRLRPIEYGIDIVIQATTKYEGGYSDTPSGAVIGAKKEDAEILARASRVLGTGAIAAQTCLRLHHRLDSTESRMDRHYASALKLMAWFGQQAYVTEILCPALPGSGDHARFLKYFGKGNGLFTIAFRDNISAGQIEDFIDALVLFRVAEGWGGHVSLVLPAHPKRTFTPVPSGKMIRFHAGLEDPDDLIRDLEQAASAAGL